MKKYINTGNKDTRSGFGAGLHEAGKEDPRIMALSSDLARNFQTDSSSAALRKPI